jgi:hypothetical protein
MSQREYLKALNSEIQKLNEIIDRKILQDADYRREARRHKALLAQLRRDESHRKFSRLVRVFFPLWR